MKNLGLFYIILFSLSVFAQNNTFNFRYQIRIDEFCAANESGLSDKNQSFDDWIEVVNYGKANVNLSSMYLTNDPENLTKWRISNSDARFTSLPKGMRKILWMDKQPNQGLLHSNFKLSKKGGFIALVAPNGKTIIDSFTYKKQFIDISCGRMEGEGDRLFYFESPSPRKKNENGKLGCSRKPKISKKSGFYDKRIEVELFSKQSNNIYYTLNGAIPTKGNGVKYSEPIQIEKSAVLKARVIEDGMILSDVVSKTYFIKEKHSVPVVSISIDEKKLYDQRSGIFYGSNFKKKQSKVGHLSYFEGEKNVYKSQVKLRVHGSFSGIYPQKSLLLQSARKDGFIEYPFFDQKPQIKKYKSLVLRNGGNDWLFTRLRDAVNHALLDTSFVKTNFQAYQLVEVYINGKYWGLYNLRERMGKGYLYDNHKVNPSDIDLLERTNKVIAGDNEDYKNLLQFVAENDVRSDEVFKELSKRMDMDNFFDYQAIQIFIANVDWPFNNVKYWRNKATDSKWRWLVYDLDKTLRDVEYNSVELALGMDSVWYAQFDTAYVEGTMLFRELMNNSKFKNRFLKRLSEHMNITYGQERVDRVIGEISSEMEPLIVRHYERWYDAFMSMGPKSPSDRKVVKRDHLNAWKKNVSTLSRFVEKRKAIMDSLVIRQGWASGVYSLDIDNPEYKEAGIVRVGNTYLNKGQYSGQFYKGCSVTITAIPNDGYEFVGWEGIKKKSSTVVISDQAKLRPIFRELE